MDKEEITRRLKKISKHAVHVVGEPPFIMGLDDGIALDEAVQLLEEQEPKKPKESKPICKIIFDVPYYFCGDCKSMLNMYSTKAKFCSQCGRAVQWEHVIK